MSETDGDKPVYLHLVTATERNRIVESLKDLRVTVTGMAPWRKPS